MARGENLASLLPRNFNNSLQEDVCIHQMGVWIDKDLASQRSLLRKLLKEATRKLLEEAS